MTKKLYLCRKTKYIEKAKKIMLGNMKLGTDILRASPEKMMKFNEV